MKGLVVGAIIVVLCAMTGVCSCSDVKREEPEKGGFEAAIEDRAKEVAEELRAPLGKAESVRKMQEARYGEMEKAAAVGDE
jgi:hypothetical protein